jgi:hypothetical protein
VTIFSAGFSSMSLMGRTEARITLGFVDLGGEPITGVFAGGKHDP